MLPRSPMHRSCHVLRRTAGLAVLGALGALGAGPFAAPATAQAPAAATASPAAAPRPARRALAAEDLQGWRTIRSTQLSRDGAWFAYLLAPNEGDAEVVLRATRGDAERRFPVGEPSGDVGLALSDDGRWAAFLVHPTAEEQTKLRKQKKPVHTRAMVVELATGVARAYDRVRRVAFAGERGGWIALHGYTPDGEKAVAGADLRLVELGTGQLLTFAGAGEFGFSDDGALLAWTVDLPDRIGNTLMLRDLRSGVVRPLDTADRALYRRLAWADSGRALAVLRGAVDSVARDTAWSVLGLADAAGGALVALDGRGRAELGDSLRVAGHRTPAWTDDRRALVFGLVRHDAPADTTVDAELPDLVLWHGRDPRLQSMQQVQESRDRAHSDLTVWHPREDRIVRLGDDALREVAILPGGRWAVGHDVRAYELEGNLTGVRRRDLHAIDVRSGERRRLLTGLQFPHVVAPDGRQLLYWQDAHYHVLDLATGQSRNVTTGAPVSFVNVEDDHNVENPPVSPVGWTADSRTVLLSDGWDVWQVPAAGGRAVNLTGDGRGTRTRYRYRLFGHAEERGIPADGPLYFSAYGERTKREGVVRVDPRRPGARSLLAEDARLFLTKARDADVVLFSRQTAVQFPDWYATDLAFRTPRRLTDANPQQRELAWSPGARLVDYVTDKGDSLQAALFLPAGYQEGEAYPTVVYIYEKLSQNLHAYSVPNETRALNPSVYTSRGYAVLMPDITYTVNDPGMSAVWSVLPAVKAAVATGVVDSTNVALHGHSWGGYQTAFLVTQTNMFKAAIAGAPLTDLVSMYSSVYWNTGSANQPIFQSSQGRFRGNFLDNVDAYVRNSPNRFADRVQTPLIILHNDKDGAVDFNQGVTYYNTLRQLGKDVIMLQYVGENHGLRKPENQKDYAVRMREFFDHHLRGDPAPEWMTEGVPHLQMKDHLRERARKPAAKKVAM